MTIVGGKVALTHYANGFGGVTSNDRLLTSSGTGPSLWSLANTDLVVEDAALVDLSRLVRFTGRLAAEDRGFTAGLAIAYPGTLAATEALALGSMLELTTVARRYDALLGALDMAGVLAKLEALYIFAAGNEAAARVNLANPKRGPLALVGTGTALGFAANRGYTGAGGQYLQLPVITVLAGARYQQDSASMGVVSRTASGATINRDLTLRDGTTNIAYVDPFSGSPTAKFQTLANDASVDASAMTGATGPLGFYAWSRPSHAGYSK